MIIIIIIIIIIIRIHPPLDIARGGAGHERVRRVRGEEGVDHLVAVALRCGHQAGGAAHVGKEEVTVRVAAHQ